MKRFLLAVIIALNFATIYSQGITAKREFRSVWIATVANIDWPPSGGTPELQKNAMISILNNLQAAGINAVFFQVRTECDAFYNSPYEPWSYWLTGMQGKAPSPVYDPLEFVINEGHKRGIEVHAWINPYRAEKTVGAYTLSSQHVVKQHPEWIVTYSGLNVLDPGLPAVREYDTKIIMDIVRRYDVDGIHFDDYFYPYPVAGVTFQDDATFNANNRGFTNKADWRRDNVNIFVKMVYDSIQSVKPYVKFGVSPFGIWKSGYPSGITGMSAYSDIYCDALAWIQQKSIDYITPQLYWQITGGQDYSKLMPWWASQAASTGRHFYPGHAAYRMVQSGSWPVTEILDQLRLDKGNPNCQGSVLYSSNYVTSNSKNLADSLKTGLYKYPALTPVMTWKDSLPPNPVKNLRYDKIASTGLYGLTWDQPDPAADKNQGAKFVIYKFNSPTVTQSDIDNPANIFGFSPQTEYVPAAAQDQKPTYFVVTALDHFGNESKMSGVLQVSAPLAPGLIAPANYAVNQRDTITLKWNLQLNASAYLLQVSTDSLFNIANLAKDDYTDTSYVITGLAGQQKYYWRVRCKNAAGYGDYSSVNSFITGFPVKTDLSEPKHATINVTVNPVFKWMKNPLAQKYRFQLSYAQTMTEQNVLIDSVVVTDTTLQVKNLTALKNHYWRVAAVNQYGQAQWSSVFGFKTENPNSVLESSQSPDGFYLGQNYPNPFNPSTIIEYHIPKSQKVTLKIHDVLGREIAMLVNEYKNAGNYSVEYYTNLPSGAYYYTLTAGEYSSTKKMIVIK
jgi:uncharacterized lipoprotein YddW (UPF0748 family)